MTAKEIKALNENSVRILRYIEKIKKLVSERRINDAQKLWFSEEMKKRENLIRL